MKFYFFNEDVVYITSVSVFGTLMICGNSYGNDSLSENNADSVFGCCAINSSTEFMN